MQCLVNIDVSDLEQAIRFYEAAFGLKVGRSLAGGITEMLGSSAPIYLLARAADSPTSGKAGPARSYDRHWTPVHLDFVVDDIEAAVDRARAAGAVLEEPIRTDPWGRLALMADPFGHGFCFVQFLGRGYDEIASQASLFGERS